MKKISFKKLPRDVRNTVLRLQRPESDRFVFFRRLSPLYWLPVAAAAVWLFYFLFATQYYLWEEWMFWIFAGVTVVAVLAAAYAIEKIAGFKFAKLKNGYIFTPDECLKITGDCIEPWNLKDIDALRYHEDIKEIELWTGTHEERIKTTQKLDAIRLCGIFDEWKANAGPGVLADHEKAEFAYSSGAKYGLAAVGAVICVLLAGAISFGAKRMNINFDDRQTWTRIDAIGTIEEYEGYKARHPHGLYAEEADRKIGDILVKLKDDYQAKAKKSADPNAVSALAAILEEAARRPDRTIFVKLNETLQVEEAVVDELRKLSGLKFEPYDSAIPKRAAEYRRNKMLGDIRQAFIPATGNGAIKFELADTPPENVPLVTVNLVIKSEPKEQIPTFRWYSFDGYKQNVVYYPGAIFNFDFVMKGGNTSTFYQTGHTAITKSLNTGLYDPRDTNNYSFDKVYFSSESESFGQFIGQVFGFVE